MLFYGVKSCFFFVDVCGLVVDPPPLFCGHVRTKLKCFIPRPYGLNYTQLMLYFISAKRLDLKHLDLMELFEMRQEKMLLMKAVQSDHFYHKVTSSDNIHINLSFNQWIVKSIKKSIGQLINDVSSIFLLINLSINQSNSNQ